MPTISRDGADFLANEWLHWSTVVLWKLIFFHKYKQRMFFFVLFLISCDVLFVYRFSFGFFFHFCQTSWLYIDCSDCITQWHYNINVLFVGDGYSSSLIMCCIISVIFKFSKGNYPDRFKVLVAGNVHVSTPLPRS